MSYTLFAETEALQPVISERTNYVTMKFIILLAHLQIPMYLFCHCHGLQCGLYIVFNEY